jgi:hypothetical protein
VTRLALIVPLLLSIALLTLAVPRVVASVLTAPAHRTILIVESGKTSEAKPLARAATYVERATGWEISARRFGELGFLRLLQAFQTDRDDPTRPALIGKASDGLRQALQLSPARPHPWVRLAYARALEDADPTELADLLTQSVRTGPYVAEISIARLDLLLRIWTHLSPDMRTYAMKQVRYIWPKAGRELLRVVRDTPRPEIIRFALRPFPEAVERVDAVLARRAK